MFTIVFAAGSSFAGVTSGNNIPTANVSYITSDEDRKTTVVSYVDMPGARVSFTTRRAGVAVIFFQTYLSADITPARPGFQIAVDNQVIFNTEMVGGSTFASIPGIFAHNWSCPLCLRTPTLCKYSGKLVKAPSVVHRATCTLLGVRSSSNIARE
jgi:hypothetical protein